MKNRQLVCALLFTSTLCGTATAQSGTPSVLRVNDDVHFGVLSTTVPNPTEPGAVLAIEGERGLLTLRNDLTFDLSSTTHRVEVSLQSSTFPNSESGAYAVTPDAKLVLDFMPSAPGTDTAELSINHDASMAIGTRTEPDTDSFLAIALRSSTGRSVADANGTYAVVSKFLMFDQTGLNSGVASGTLMMDGAGNWTFSGQEESVTAAGVASVGSANDSGTYNVAPNGGFSFSSVETGALSPDGDVFFLVFADRNETEVGFTVGVRIGSSYSLSTVDGSWRVASHEVELGTGSAQPAVITDLSTVAVTAATGAYAATGVEVVSNPIQATAQPSSSTGTVSITSAGAATFAESGGGGSLTVTVSPTGGAFVGTEFAGASKVELGLRVCVGSGAYGTATAGTGGIAPAAGMSGFPTLGNAGFAFQVVNGVGAAPAALLIARAPSAGIPFFGGQVWVDPVRIALVPPLLLSGAAGVAGAGSGQLPLRIPSAPALAGGALYYQAMIVDPGSPAGLAMTDGFRIRICR